MNSKALLAILTALSVSTVSANFCDIDYIVFNADEDTSVGNLDDILEENGGYFCIPHYEINIQARPTPECPTTLSALMDLQGPVSEDDRIENFGPYMIFGDNNRDPINYFGRDLKPGPYILNSDIFSERRLAGDLVVSREIIFEAKFCDPVPPTCPDRFSAALSGDEEVPPVFTNVDGDAFFHVDRFEGTIEFGLVVRENDANVGLLGVAGAHIHCAPAGANGPVAAFLAGDVPGGLVGKVVSKGTLTDANFIDPSCGTTIEELAQSFCDGNAYVNVHSGNNPSGEVRGQIAPVFS